jgi:hypothetical protein
MYAIITYKNNKISVTGSYLTLELLANEISRTNWETIQKIECFSSIDSTAPFKIVGG